jgi:segregation and condensation protein B
MSEEINIPTNLSQKLNLEAKIEALLFVSPRAVTAGKMAEVLRVTPREVEKALRNLEILFKNRGIHLQKNRGRYQLTTVPETSQIVEDFLNLEITTRLSKASLETLAIIAYQQPITRPMIDSIRGVNSDSVIKTLQSKGLIEETGRSEKPGRPILYTTSPEFLQHFGLSSITDLPTLTLPYNRKIKPGSTPIQQEITVDAKILKE